MDLSQFSVSFEAEKKQFELDIQGDVAVIQFILNKQNTIFLTHTEVPKSLEGKGVGNKIVGETLEYIKKEDWKLAPLCPFVAAYLKRHPEYQSLLAPGYNIW